MYYFGSIEQIFAQKRCIQIYYFYNIWRKKMNIWFYCKFCFNLGWKLLNQDLQRCDICSCKWFSHRSLFWIVFVIVIIAWIWSCDHISRFRHWSRSSWGRGFRTGTLFFNRSWGRDRLCWNRYFITKNHNNSW